MKRIDIMEALGALLGAITVANGSNTDLGLNLLYWQDYATEYEEDALIYRDGDEDITEANSNHEYVLHTEIEAHSFSENPGLRANKCLQDIVLAIGKNITFSGLASKITLLGSETEVETDGKSACKVLVKLDIHYRTPKFNP